MSDEIKHEPLDFTGTGKIEVNTDNDCNYWPVAVNQPYLSDEALQRAIVWITDQIAWKMSALRGLNLDKHLEALLAEQLARATSHRNAQNAPLQALKSQKGIATEDKA